MSNLIESLPRNFTRDDWKRIYKIIRRSYRYNPLDDRLAEREQLAKELRDANEDGLTCIVYSGIDCDCSAFVHAYVVESPTVIAFELDREKSFDYADGPLSIAVCKPSERPASRSRDLALEAYEDGHSHCVYFSSV